MVTSQNEVGAVGAFFVNHITAFLIDMKKTTRRNQPSAPTHRGFRACRSQERWTFSHTSERLFALGSAEGVQRFAYRTMMGELRFLPL
jgi:hypothetical protein